MYYSLYVLILLPIPSIAIITSAAETHEPELMTGEELPK
jgi:hypothetical protein